jgi:hypothetical protein
MNWYNLLKNKCPKCNKDFMKGLKVEKLECETTQKRTVQDAFPSTMIHPCGFKITEQRYKEIVADMTVKNINKSNQHYDDESTD